MSRQLNLKRAERGPLGHAIKLAKDDSERALALERAQALKETIHRLEKELETIEGKLLPLAESLPNDTHPSAPIGGGSAALIVSTHGPPPTPASSLRDHVHVGRVLDLVDMESAATVTGSSWYYLKNEGALLELALTNYAMSIALKAGFTPVMTPDVVKVDIARRCGFHPRDESGNAGPSQNYYLERRRLEEPELVLAGTAEIPLAGLLARRTLEEKELPVMFAGLGRAFRSEAGARGVDTRGLYRVHQFSKVELFVVTKQEESDRMMEQMTAIQREIFGGLNIPFRVLDMPTEDLGASAYRKYDMEAWMPGRGSWGEISSTSNCTEYQSRRLHIVYKPSRPDDTAGPLPFAHTLNGTAAAIPRLIVALLENGARIENDAIVGIDLPLVLRPFWLGGVNSEKIHFI